MLGLSTKIQAIAVSRPGIANDSSASAWNSEPPGASVRSTTHATDAAHERGQHGGADGEHDANCRTGARCASSNRPRRNSAATRAGTEAGVLGEGGVEQRRQRHEHEPPGHQDASDEREVARPQPSGKSVCYRALGL